MQSLTSLKKSKKSDFKSYGILAVFFIKILFFATSSISQIRRHISPTSASCYRIPVSPLSYAPPLHMDMPLKTIFGYIYFDSLMRNFSSAAQIDSFLEQINNYDTLKFFDAYLYAMVDYDPILFYEYLFAGGSVNSLYRANPIQILSKFFEKSSSINNVPLKHRYLVNAGLIQHIKVIYQINSVDTLGHPLPFVCVTSQVLDTIKGKHFISGDCGLYHTPLNYPSCINFSFSPIWNYKGNTDGMGITLDSLGNFVYQDSYGKDFLSDDSEYIAFFSTYFHDYDGTNAYYTYWPFTGPGLHGGFLRVDSNHNVHDDENLFGYGTLVNINTFKGLLRQDINTIIHP
jgi:hypothetical protein